jgi:hypothetical protein
LFLLSSIGTAEIEVDETASSATWRALLAKEKSWYHSEAHSLFWRGAFGLKSYGTLCTTNKRGQTGLTVLGGMELVLHNSFFQAFSSQCISNW